MYFIMLIIIDIIITSITKIVIQLCLRYIDDILLDTVWFTIDYKMITTTF
jgi:hypothetical protein